MADITGVYKASLKAAKDLQKDLGSSGKSTPSTHSSVLVTARKRRGSKFSDVYNFATKAREIVGSIKELKSYLLKHKVAYLNTDGRLLSLSHSHSRMSDLERDKMDAEVQEFVRTCRTNITGLQNKELSPHVGEQAKDHLSAVVRLLETYLQRVCQIQSGQKAIRVKRAIERRKYGLLRSSTSLSSSSAQPTTSLSDTADGTTSSHQQTTTTGQSSSSGLSNGSTPRTTPRTTPRGEGNEKPAIEVITSVFEEEVITREESDQFIQENAEIFEEFTSMTQEVRSIEGKVVEISKLQQIFTENILDQEKVVDRIGETVVSSTEDVVQGNEDIREAMKNNAGMRVWVLFFIIVLSFTLLFLDWYND